MPKNALLPIRLVNNGDMSANITSNAIDIAFLDNVAVEAIPTGAPTGTLSIEGSNDHAEYFGQVTNAGTWVNITSFTAYAGSGSPALKELVGEAVRYIRVKYAFTSGTGTLNVYVSAKSL